MSEKTIVDVKSAVHLADVAPKTGSYGREFLYYTVIDTAGAKWIVEFHAKDKLPPSGKIHGYAKPGNRLLQASKYNPNAKAFGGKAFNVEGYKFEPRVQLLGLGMGAGLKGEELERFYDKWSKKLGL